jgi:hypothetical protein
MGMERDINTIIDVDPKEASVLIGLIETLIEEWYVHRHDRNARMESIIAVAAAKQEQKDEASAKTKETQEAAPDPGA